MELIPALYSPDSARKGIPEAPPSTFGGFFMLQVKRSGRILGVRCCGRKKKKKRKGGKSDIPLLVGLSL